MAATDTTRIVIDLESRLRNLQQTLRGLDQIKKRLDAVAGVKSSTQASDRAAASAQKLSNQQQRLVVQTQELANRQERARQTADRLAASQQRLAQAQRRVEAANERAGRSAINLDQTLGRVGGSLRNLGLGLTSLGSAVTLGLSGPLTALGFLASRNAVSLDSLQRGLTAITGSAEEAGRQLTRLTNIAKLPGIGFQEAIQGSIRLQAVGFSAEVAERALIQFSNAVALTGGGREELARITVQLGQLSAKGKVLAQDLKPIIEAGPAVGRALLQAFGTVNSEDIQALGLSSREFLDQLLNQLEQLPRAAAGLRNTFDNFSDAVFRASAAIGNAILPVLTRLIEVAEPIITRLADGFARLPPVVQTLVVVFGALTAATGPALFVFGQFATGIGGLISAFGRLHALGLLPTIAGFQLLTKVMTGSASLMAGQAATTAAAAAGWGALGLAILGVVALAGGIALLINYQKDSVKISKEQIAANAAQIDSLQDQIKFVDQLAVGVQRTADQQERLAEIYADLNTQAKIRVTAITDEEKRLAALREELGKLLVLREQERVQQAANLAASLASSALQIQSGQQERDSIAARVQANAALAKSISETGRLTVEQSKQLALQGINASTTEEAIGGLNAENEALIGSQTSLIDTSKELNGTATEQGEALRILQRQTGLSTRELLSAAKAMGVFKGDVESTLPIIERFINAQERAARATAALDDVLIKAGKDADAAERARKDRIEAAASLAREASTSFEGALKFMRAFIAAQPDLAAAIQKELQLQQKSMDEFLRDLLSRGAGRAGGNQLRNAQEALAKARIEVAESEAERLQAIEQLKNERLLQLNENQFQLQLISLRQFLNERARLLSAQAGLEIDEQRRTIAKLAEQESRSRRRAGQAGIGVVERTRAEAAAAEAATKRKAAETELLRLQQQQRDAQVELQQAIAVAAKQQEEDVRSLQVEYGELTGRIEDALNAATDERFREALQQLAKAQDDINQRLQLARETRSADDIIELELAQRLNQTQIDTIRNIVTQERATNQLTAANEFVRRAKERQAELERQIGFEVEFRGLKEEQAIARRLEGERRLADSLTVVRDLVQAQIDALEARGVKPPQALIDFIRDTKAAIAGLGELSFTEQFRLAEKEFNRINDERVRKIQDVERAVRDRTIAEVEGQIIIRQINGQYTADLEAQLVLLRQIADASGQDDLKSRADDAGEVVKDTQDRIADLSKQIESAGKDAFKSGLTDFFVSLGDRSIEAKDKILNLLDSIVQRVNEVIAENLSQKLFESIFGGADSPGDGLLAKIRGFFGGGDSGKAIVGEAAGKAVETTAAATALTTGAAAAGTALVTAGTAAGATMLTSMAAAATAFSATIVAAGAAFAAAVSVGQAAGGAGSLLSGFAATGLFPAVPGGMYRIVEGGYPEAVITTDPKHAARQVSILRELIAKTRGFQGRIQIPDLAIGGIVSRETAEANLLSAIHRPSAMTPRLPDLALAGNDGGRMTLRQIFVDDQRDISNWYNSAEGDRVQVEWLARNRVQVRSLLGVRE